MATVKILVPGPYRADTMTGQGQLMIKSQMLDSGDFIHFQEPYAEFVQSQKLAVIVDTENIDLEAAKKASLASPTPPPPARKKATTKPLAAKKKAVPKKDTAAAADADAVKQPVAAAKKPVTEPKED